MTRDKLKAKFPHASEAFLSANETHILNQPTARDRNNASQGKAKGSPMPVRPIVEPDSSDATLDTAPVQAGIGQVFLVRITVTRKRLLDEDNLCGKYATDLLRRSGIVPDDSPDKTRIEVRQFKAQKNQPEGVLIEVFEIGIDTITAI